MCVKQLAIIFTVLVIFKSGSGATFDDARAALRLFEKQFITYQDVLTSTADSQKALLQQQLARERGIVDSEITTKVNDVLNKISNLTNNAHVSVDDCVATIPDKVKNFSADILQKWDKCSNVLASDTNILFDSVMYNYENNFNSYFDCSNMSLEHCNQYENTTTCFDFVIEQINAVQSKFLQNIEPFTDEINNVIYGVKSPCKEMVDNHINFYPDFLMESVNFCVDTLISSRIDSTC